MVSVIVAQFAGGTRFFSLLLPPPTELPESAVFIRTPRPPVANCWKRSKAIKAIKAITYRI